MKIFYSTRKFEEATYKKYVASCVLADSEVLYKENPNGVGLTILYNEILKQYPQDIIVFIHDDLSLERGWDEKIKNLFETYTDYAIIGVAGTNVLDKTGIWWQQRHLMVGQVAHPSGLSKYSEKHDYLMQVAVVDGLLMAVNPKNLKANFNEKYDKFHFYDITFCADNALLGAKIGVTTSFGIRHESVGRISGEWIKYQKQFTEEYSSVLPLQVEPDYPPVAEVPRLKNIYPIDIIIPSKNNFDYLQRCLLSIDDFSTDLDIKVHVADTGSDEDVLEKTRNLLSSLKVRSELHIYDYYNFAKINNDVAKKTRSEAKMLVLCNDDVEILTPVFHYMLQVYQRNERVIGTIGVKLFYPNKLVQHGGIFMGIQSSSNNLVVSHVGLKTYHNAPSNAEKNVLGSTGALLGVDRTIYLNSGGLNETYETHFEDVEFNLKMLNLNRKNIYLGNVYALHHESISRNKPDQEKSQKQYRDYIRLKRYVDGSLKKTSASLWKYVLKL